MPFTVILPEVGTFGLLGFTTLGGFGLTTLGGFGLRGFDTLGAFALGLVFLNLSDTARSPLQQKFLHPQMHSPLGKLFMLLKLTGS
ncbi:MAG: hypothetical protein NWR47_00785 [Aestuariivirgaceae bacterium]|nr:hypothetical protein [Aestuariivirgaceae bacterium]